MEGNEGRKVIRLFAWNMKVCVKVVDVMWMITYNKEKEVGGWVGWIVGDWNWEGFVWFFT